VSAAPISDELLHAYVDGALEAQQRAEVERYLASDPDAAQRVAAYASQREMLRNAYAHVLEEAVPQRFAAANRRAPRDRLVRVAAVLAWIVFGGVLGWMLRGEAPEGNTAAGADADLVQRARLAHKIYVAEGRRAVEVAAAEEESMVRWLSKRMNAAVRVPDLREFGFEALGGRLLPGVAGPACQLMYQNADGKRITIYLARADGKPKTLRFGDDDAVHVVFWSDGTLAFAVSGELDKERLTQIAAAVARASGSRG
jgi:anti-sigma factor RsiW